MIPTTVALTGRSDLRKHVGQKITVTGSLSHGMSETMSNDRDTLAVSTLKVVAKSLLVRRKPWSLSHCGSGWKPSQAAKPIWKRFCMPAPRWRGGA